MKFILKTILSLIVIAGLSSCEKFFDINDDPNNPVEPQSNLLLTSSEVAISSAVSMSTGGLSGQLSVFMHQITRRGEGDQYGTQGNDFMITTAWGSFYDIAMQDLETIIASETENDNMIYVGVAKLLKAYSYSTMVDVWGDLPFTEANNIVDFTFPRFDDDATIYPALLALIDEAIVDINNTESTNIIVPGADDVIYGGNTDNWIRFGNTLKLKMLYQTTGVSTIPNRDVMINQLITDNNLITDASQDFELWYNATGPAPENRHPVYVTEYTQANPNFYVSVWLYETLQGLNLNVLNGVVDPRIPYYYHRQLLPGEAPENPFEYLKPEGFLSIHFGSIHPNQASGQQSSQSVVGVYACGGFYDDGSGTKVNATSGNGVAPERMLTYFKRLYMEAELALNGVIGGDARALLQSAIEASFAEVNEVAAAQASVPAISTADRDAYVASALAEYDAGDNTKKLEVILTQKWLASFGNSVDAYADYRRTGFPVIFDPNNYNGPEAATYQATTTSGRPFLVSLPWSDQDLQINANAPAQKDPTSDKVFWDAN